MINPASTALLIIDVQVAFEQRDKRGDKRNNPMAENNIAALLTHFRTHRQTVIHIHHHSLEPDSLFRAELSGSEVQKFVEPQADELVYVKHVNSAFIGTTLEQDLLKHKIDTLICCGATGNHCVETTTRMAGNLGFKTFFIHDAVWTYDAKGPDGTNHTADEILSVTLCNLHGEFATVSPTDEIINLLNLHYS